MKRVILKRLTLRNFRGEKERTTSFNEADTTIAGQNGLGKSRHFDAFVWLLFGKDTQDRKDYNIKTLVNGKPLQKVDCEVTGVLDINGETITLRRVFAEKWVKPRGSAEERFEGHEHLLFWNNVPLKLGEYQGRINAIIDDSVFKMITNPMFFANMDWKKQREQLFQLAGTISDAEIAAQKPEYKALLDRISGKPLEDFKREISARKRKLKDELEQIQPRIDQTQKLMPANIDFAALETELTSLEKQLSDIDKAIADKSAAIRQQYDEIQKQHGEINDLKNKQQQILFDAQTEVKEAAYTANAIRRDLENNIKSAEIEIAGFERSIQACERELQALKDRITSKEKEVEIKRQEWYKGNAIEYEGNDVCSACGQQLPEESRANARQMFADEKTKKLTEISQKGGEINAEIEQLNKDIGEVATTLQTKQNDLKSKQDELSLLKEQLKQIPAAVAEGVVAASLPEWVGLDEQIKAIEVTIESDALPVDTTELQNQKKDITVKLDVAKSELKTRDLIIRYGIEIKELEDKGKEIAQQIANAEREEYTIQNFTKAKIDECERRINGLFSHVTFRLLEYTIDNNEIETCVPLVNGVPFGAANTAGQILAGLDIICALQRFHNALFPVFCDHAESVNHYPTMENQMIFLKVTDDKELIIA